MEKYFTITRDALKKKIDEGSDFVLVDVLGQGSYEQRHLPGAISIDAHASNFVKQVEKRIPDKNEEVVVYCASFTCPLSPKAASDLTDAGYKNVVDFEGGLADWQDAGYSFEAGKERELAQSSA